MKKKKFEPICEPVRNPELDNLLLSLRVRAITHLVSLMFYLNAKPAPELKKDLEDLAKAIAKLST